MVNKLAQLKICVNMARKSNIWDKVYKEFKGKRFSVWKENATPFIISKIPFLKHNNVKKILDAGCGDGRNLLLFVKEGFSVIGVDSSLEACKKALRVKQKYQNVEIRKADLCDLGINEIFDAIICDFVIVHVKEVKKVIDNFFKYLKNGGFLLIEFVSTDDPAYGKGKSLGNNSFLDKGIFYRFYSISEVKKLLKKFEILDIKKIKHFDPGHTANYPRSKPHIHDSIYILAKKAN